MKKIILSVLLMGSAAFAANFAACAACHGAKGEKKALGKSEVIKGWDVEKTTMALKGYKDGSYGKAMKGVMKGQVARLSDADIKDLAMQISKF
jgi:cytochrome c553